MLIVNCIYNLVRVHVLRFLDIKVIESYSDFVFLPKYQSFTNILPLLVSAVEIYGLHVSEISWSNYYQYYNCCGSLLELLSRSEITVCDVYELFLLNEGALVAQINDLHF